MLKEQIRQIVEANPDYAAVTPVIEKEILHHDIMDVMIKQGAIQTLTFIGGTSLRMCYNSARLSEDLDFNGGHDFKPAQFDGISLPSYFEAPDHQEYAMPPLNMYVCQLLSSLVEHRFS